MDIQLIFLTAMAIISKVRTLFGIQNLLAPLHADECLKKMVARREVLRLFPSPSTDEIVMLKEAERFR